MYLCLTAYIIVTDQYICVLTAVSNGTVSEDVSSAIPLQQQASADQLCLVSGLDSINDECDGKMEKSSANGESHEDHMMMPEGQSFGTDTSQLEIGDSNTGIAEGAVNEAVNGSRSSDASNVPVDPQSGITETEELGDKTDRKPVVDWYNVAACGSAEQCIRCNKPRPMQQCPVCSCMYASVPLHIGVHCIRKFRVPMPQSDYGGLMLSDHWPMCM